MSDAKEKTDHWGTEKQRARNTMLFLEGTTGTDNTHISFNGIDSFINNKTEDSPAKTF